MSGAIVMGSGRSVWRDLAAINRPSWPVFAVNEMICFSPRLDHAVSHHHAKLPHWLALRTLPTAGVTRHSSVAAPGLRAWPEYRGGGSSTLLAVRIARALGFRPVWVAGVPLDGQGYVWEPPDLAARDHTKFRPAWERARAELLGHVYSPSGFLRELLGAPAELAA